MKKIFHCTFLFIVLNGTSFIYAQESLAPEDLNVIKGLWKGSLTYTNYSDGSPFTMPAELEVKTGKNKYQFELFTSYPNEPHANGKGMIKLSKDGTKVNNKPITSIEKMANDEVRIVTEHQGKDDDKKALIKNSYTIGTSTLIIRKEVKFEGAERWLTRNEYRYAR